MGMWVDRGTFEEDVHTIPSFPRNFISLRHISSFWIKELMPAAFLTTNLYSLSLTLPGLNAEVVYSLSDSSNGHFSIEETTGVIRLEKPLKDSQHSAFELTVCATDQGTPQPLSALGTVTVSVVDLNEYLPVFLAPEYVAMVKEDVAVGTEVLNLSALTRDNTENTEIKYEIVNGKDHGKFQLNSNTAKMVSSSKPVQVDPTCFIF